MALSPYVISRILKGFSIFSIATGTLDLCFGTAKVPGLSDTLSTGSPVAALVDSQIRFLGTMWAGYGVMLWWTSNDLHTRQVPMGLLGSILVAGGIGRLMAGLKHGFGASWVKVATGVELAGPLVLYVLSY